jgi:hypothetical protein
MQSSLPAGWLAFSGRELNPLDRYKRFQITFSSPFSGLILAQRKFHGVASLKFAAIAGACSKGASREGTATAEGDSRWPERRAQPRHGADPGAVYAASVILASFPCLERAASSTV